ncbi:nucleotidyltransferase family protein [Membranihabitans maritimus]|uniref:nucleotidyltransferase family protein n=1 Tax=Membranihabitans maritimus TaxID=2904244 RepID=UPI0034E1AA5C
MDKGTLDIILQFRTIILALYGERLSQVLLFGSYARGDAKDESDLDFLIVF